MLDLPNNDFWEINSKNDYTIKDNGFVHLLHGTNRERFFEVIKRYDDYYSLRMCSENPFCPIDKCANPRCSFQIKRSPFLEVLQDIKRDLRNLGLPGSFFPRVEELIDELIDKFDQTPARYVTFVSHNHR